MSESDQDKPDSKWQEGSDPERFYVITGGRTGQGGRITLDLVTLIVATAPPEPTTPPEEAAVLRMCASPLSLAEISAYMKLPISVVTVLITDMLVGLKLEARSPVPKALLPDVVLLEAVMHGLQKL